MACIGGHHHHDHGHHSGGDGKRLIAAFAVIVVFMILETVGGILSGSLALLADATHMFTDALALALAASAQYIANRPADKHRHFGYSRFQVVAAFVNGIGLCLLLLWIFIEAIRRFMRPDVTVEWKLMLTVAVLGLIANGIAFLILHNSKTNNVNVRGAMLHVVSDLLGSLAAIIAALIIAATGYAKADAILSVIVALLIGRSAIRLVRDTGHILMEGAPTGIDFDGLKMMLTNEVPEVKGVYGLRIWQLTPTERQLTCRVKIDKAADTQQILAAIKNLLKERFKVGHSTIEFELCDENAEVAVDENCDDSYLKNDPAPFLKRPIFSGKAGAISLSNLSGKRAH